MNRVLLVGRIANEITYNKTNNGISYARTSIAINRRGVQDQTDFIPVVGWRNTADIMNSIMAKGALVSIEGTLISNSYQNSEGKIVRNLEVHIERIVSLESKATVQSRNLGNNYNNYNNSNNNNQNQNSRNNNPSHNFGYNNNETDMYNDYLDYKNSIQKNQKPTFGQRQNQSVDNDVDASDISDVLDNIDTLD